MPWMLSPAVNDTDICIIFSIYKGLFIQRKLSNISKCEKLLGQVLKILLGHLKNKVDYIQSLCPQHPL